MTKIIESITVDVMCENTWSLSDRCHAEAAATMVATPNGDLVLYPVGWQVVQATDSREGVPLVGVLCPKHRRKS